VWPSAQATRSVGDTSRALSALSIRDATVADLEQVRDIKVGNWAGTYGPLIPPAALQPYLDRPKQLESLREQLRLPTTSLLVAVDEADTVLGFALFYPRHDPDPWMESLHVAPGSRGRGVGTLLMSATASRVAAAGHHRLRLGVVVGNEAAAHFYEGLGGTRVGEEPVDWAEGVRHWIYRWPDVRVMILPARVPGGQSLDPPEGRLP
jgi:ribosomal protein S18 acetylase RimI-like enzyme